MKTSELKILAAGKLMEMKLPKAKKIENLEFIRTEAKSYELKSFILDETFDGAKSSMAQDILNSRFKNYISEAGVIGNLFVILSGWGAPFWAAYRLAGAAFKSCNRKCGVFTISNKRDLCKIKCEIIKIEKQIAVVKQANGGCPKSKDPQKCKAAAAYELGKLSSKQDKLKEKLKMLNARD